MRRSETQLPLPQAAYRSSLLQLLPEQIVSSVTSRVPIAKRIPKPSPPFTRVLARAIKALGNKNSDDLALGGE